MTGNRSSNRVLVGLLGALFFGAPVHSQVARRMTATGRSYRDSPSIVPTFTVNAPLTLVPVSVTDAMDCPVTDLTKSSFRIFEDDSEHDILSLHKEEGPASVGFIIDTSRSMSSRLGASIAAVEQFLATGIPGDEYFLISFASSPMLITDFTDRPEDISRALSSLQAGGWTALNDAIFRGVHVMRHAKNVRRALIVLSDGADNFSRYGDSEVRKLVRESDLRMYSIGLLTNPDLLVQLSRESGGSALCARQMEELPKIVDKLSTAFRNEYLLGYAPGSRGMDGKYHRIRVQLVPKDQRRGMHISWRHGYYAPGY